MNGTAVMKHDDGEGDMFLSKICGRNFKLMMIESRSQIRERNFSYENNDGDGDMFLSQICERNFDG